MFNWWFRQSRLTGVTPLIAEGCAVYAIGDIHGRLDLLGPVMEQVRDDASRHPADHVRRLIFLGDYIDRGPESRGVIETLCNLSLSELTCTFLLGNHEEAMLDFLDGKSDGLGWLNYGGLETLASYGVPLALPTSDEIAAELRHALRVAVPQTHVEFLRSCALTDIEGDFVFVHAGVRPGRSLEQQVPQDLLWIRDSFLRSPAPLPGWVVVHGHTICDTPQDLGYRINIDTGAFVSGRLTCLVLRGTTRRFLTTDTACV